MYSVLVAEDEPMIRMGITTLITKSGYPISKVRTADNGVHALELIAEELPDFLFTDIRMPKMDGIVLCESVYHEYKTIQAAVISGYNDFEYARKCMKYGVKDYILKPITQKTINQALECLIKAKEASTLSVYVSPSQIQQWVEQIEEAIWKLDENKVHDLFEQMMNGLRSYALKKETAEHFVNDLMNLLCEKINRRNVYRFSLKDILAKLDHSEEPYLKLENTLKLILSEIKRKRKGKIKDPIEEAKEFISENLTKDVSLEEVAERIGLNPSYFSQLFKQSTDETFISYRIRMRMEKAKQMLAIPHYKITDISYEVGYADHPHFTKTFKKYMGYTPSEYRAMLGIK